MLERNGGRQEAPAHPDLGANAVVGAVSGSSTTARSVKPGGTVDRTATGSASNDARVAPADRIQRQPQARRRILRATRCDRGEAASSRWPSLACRRAGAAAARTRRRGDGSSRRASRAARPVGGYRGWCRSRGRHRIPLRPPADPHGRSQPAQRVFVGGRTCEIGSPPSAILASTRQAASSTGRRAGRPRGRPTARRWSTATLLPRHHSAPASAATASPGYHRPDRGG